MPLELLGPRASRPARAAVPAWLLLAPLLGPCFSPTAAALDLGGNFTLGGSLAVTSDYIYRGVSESDGHGALQADLHVDEGGSFIGAWSSTRDHNLDPYADYDLEVYLGHRFDLSSSWSSTVSARAHYFVAGMQEESADYEELTASVTWLDRWTLALSSIPNAPHYWYDERLGRSPAWIAESSGQWLLLPQGLFVTGGAGYYYASRTGAGIAAGGGYAYGNAGLAFEYRRWRLDVGYFVAQSKAGQILPYPVSDRVAGTIAWRF
jgi:uncharacterized protein (TIGR02001 family)